MRLSMLALGAWFLALFLAAGPVQASPDRPAEPVRPAAGGVSDALLDRAAWSDGVAGVRRQRVARPARVRVVKVRQPRIVVRRTVRRVGYRRPFFPRCPEPYTSLAYGCRFPVAPRPFYYRRLL